MIRVLWGCVLVVSLLACDSDFTTPDIVLVNLGINPVSSEITTSYERSKALDASSLPLIIDYSILTASYDATRSNKAIAYLDAEDDLDTDVFFAMSIDSTNVAEKAELYIYDSTGMSYADDADTFFPDNNDPPLPNVPTSVNASKSLVSDFTGDGLDDIFIVDQANDVSTHDDEPRLIIHRTELSDPNDVNSALIHSFVYQIFAQDEGDHTTAAAADIDNDSVDTNNDRDIDGDDIVDEVDDIDIFVGGSDPFFYINNGFGGFNRVNNRWDQSMSRVDAAELVDVDMDGYVDLLAGADEANDATYIYWGNSTGTYSSDLRTLLPAHTGYGVILDFEVENLDGDSNKDIVIYRTSATDTDRVIQIIKNNGGRSFAINSAFTVSSTSSAWLRAQDWEGDTDIDIFPDNAAAGFRLENNGSGVFTQIP